MRMMGSSDEKATTSGSQKESLEPARKRTPRNFDPNNIAVLVVDDDSVCLSTITFLLNKCYDRVHGCTSSTEALKLLRGGKDRFDIVLLDVFMPELDGFKLLEIIGLEMCLPVIMMSVDGDDTNVLKGVTHGAVDFLIKPVRHEELKNIWQHVYRKVITDRAEKKEEGRGKKPRMIWTPELHQRFVDAVNKLGLDHAVPKKIKELMGIPFLRREHIASHLQKYRLYLKQMPCFVGQGTFPVAMTMYNTPGEGFEGASSPSVQAANQVMPVLGPSDQTPTPVMHSDLLRAGASNTAQLNQSLEFQNYGSNMMHDRRYSAQYVPNVLKRGYTPPSSTNLPSSIMMPVMDLEQPQMEMPKRS